MKIKAMVPPDDGSRDTVIANGRTYSSTPGVAIDVPYFDANVLEANGWYAFTASAPSAPPSVSSVPGLATMIANDGFQVLTDRPINISGFGPLPLSSARSGCLRGYTVRIRQRALFAATHIKLVFGNYTSDNALTETPNHNPIEYRACLQKFGASATDYTPARIPVTFNNGSQFGTVQPDGMLFSDPIGFEVGANEIFYIWVYPAVAGNGWYVTSGLSTMGFSGLAGCIANGEGYNFEDIVLSGNLASNSNLSAATGPIAVLGLNPAPQRTVAIAGDSIATGTGDAGSYSQCGGWPMRLMINQQAMQLTAANAVSQLPNFSYVWMARGGLTAASFAARQNSYKQVKLAEMATNILWEYGTNDLSIGLPAMQANALAVARWFIHRGKKFIAATLLPKTTSTDNFLTIANQTVTGSESVRTGYNSWLRDASANGFISWASGLSGPAWAPSTSYPTIGAIVQSAGGVYAVTSVGTSASSGSGLSGSGMGIVDGTVVWRQLLPITGLVDFVDAAATVEVNAAGVPTLNGGFWPAPPTPADYTGSVTAGSSNSQFTDSALGNTIDQWRGYNVRMTSGVGASGSAMAPGINLNSTGSNNIVLANSLPGVPAIGDTYAIYRPYSQEGTHPSAYGHSQIANGLNVLTVLAKFI